jgi:hypothetical protein
MSGRIGFHGQLQGECRTCHTDHRGRDANLIALDTASFNHNQARFALDGKHQKLECDACHIEHSPMSAQRRFTGFELASCSSCHDDPHHKSLGNDCARCHTTAGWEGHDLRFDHNRDSQFAIDAIHESVSCAACHADADGAMQFRPQPTSCDACHTTIQRAIDGEIAGTLLPADPHKGRVSCVDCHAPDIASPTPAQFADRCTHCHVIRYRELYYDWERSLDDQAHAAAEMIDRLRGSDPDTAEARSERLNQVRKAGIHNVQQTVQMLRELSAASQANSTSAR